MPILKFNLEDRSPFDKVLRLSKDATLPALEFQLFDDDAVVDLTGGTATFSMDDEAGTAKVNNQSATLTDVLNGKGKYEWAAVDVDTEGEFVGVFVVTVGTRVYRIPDNDNQKLRIVIGPRVN